MQPTCQSIIGKSALELFRLSKSQISDISHPTKIELIDGYTLHVTTDQDAIYLRYRDYTYNIIYIFLGPDFEIQEVNLIIIDDTSKAAASGAFSALSDLPGFSELQNYLGIKNAGSFEKNAWKEMIEKSRIENSIVPTHNLVLPMIQDSDNATTVAQHEYSILQYDENNEKNALKTWGAGPCIIVSIFNPSAKIGILMHIDASTDFKESMRKISDQLSYEFGISFYDNNWDVALFGGDYGFRMDIYNTRNTLKTYDFNFIGEKILSGNHYGENIWLDVETGDLFNFETDPSLASNQIIADRLRILEFLIHQKTPLNEI